MTHPAPRSALLASNLATHDRFARLTETAAVTFTDDVAGSTTEGRAMMHHAPRTDYARKGNAPAA